MNNFDMRNAMREKRVVCLHMRQCSWFFVICSMGEEDASAWPTILCFIYNFSSWAETYQWEPEQALFQSRRLGSIIYSIYTVLYINIYIYFFLNDADDAPGNSLTCCNESILMLDMVARKWGTSELCSFYKATAAFYLVHNTKKRRKKSASQSP